MTTRLIDNNKCSYIMHHCVYSVRIWMWEEKKNHHCHGDPQKKRAQTFDQIFLYNWTQRTPWTTAEHLIEHFNSMFIHYYYLTQCENKFAFIVHKRLFQMRFYVFGNCCLEEDVKNAP